MNFNDTVNRIKTLMSGYNLETITTHGDLYKFPGLKLELKENNTKIGEVFLVDISIAINEEKYVSHLHKKNVFVENDMIYLYGLEIKPQYRGGGYGKKLMNECLNSSLKMGYKKMSLMVNETNQVARNLYTKKGFKYITEIDGGVFLEKIL
jgi:ribosomal protein S18 acetylase RimI-like enzyme